MASESMSPRAVALAARDLREASRRLDDALVGRGLTREPVRAQARELAADTAICSEMLDEAFAERAAEWRTAEATPGSTIAILNFGGPTDADAAGRLVVTMKAFYFFLRAHQDAMYALVFEVVSGSRVGDARMQKAVDKPENPVGRLLRERFPEYLPWFNDLRIQRNAIKTGVNFGTIGPAEDLGISFNTVTDEGGLILDFEGTVVRVSDVARALEMSSRLAAAALGVVGDVE